jgi:uncharacterized glyoxalase superfamily protein PhnB
MPNWGVIPALRVRNMKEALGFYQDKLGFDLTRGGPGEEHCSVTRGDARLMLEVTADSYSPAYNAAIRQRLGTPSSMALYIEAEDVDALFERASGGGVAIVDPLADRPWGQSEFTVEDPDGHWLTFWRQLKATSG